MTGSRPAPIMEARGIIKRYGHVEALRGVDFAAHAGEITALIGDNGAGKSTLVKILSGVTAPTAGEILLDGRPVAFASPADAHRRGIETVYQDLSVAPDLSARPPTCSWAASGCARACSAGSASSTTRRCGARA